MCPLLKKNYHFSSIYISCRKSNKISLLQKARYDNRLKSQEMGDEDLKPEDEDDEEAEGPELSEEIEIYTSLLS